MTEILYSDAMFSGTDGDSAKLIAERSAQIWESVARKLIPLIGEQGFSILFARCIHITQRAYPWLAGHTEPNSTRFGGLTIILAERDAADARAASLALLSTFHDTLATLIGVPLANNILYNIWREPKPEQEVQS